MVEYRKFLILNADAGASCDLFLFLSGGNVNLSDGRVIVEPPTDALDSSAAPRHFVALDYLYFPWPFFVIVQLILLFRYHTNLSSVQYNVFFNLCRLKGVHFDLRERCGSAFVLLDSFSGGTVCDSFLSFEVTSFDMRN